MKTEPKFKIGDKVWLLFLGKPFKSIVYHYIGGEEKLYRCAFFLHSSVYREDELFATEQELLNSL